MKACNTFSWCFLIYRGITQIALSLFFQTVYFSDFWIQSRHCNPHHYIVSTLITLKEAWYVPHSLLHLPPHQDSSCKWTHRARVFWCLLLLCIGLSVSLLHFILHEQCSILHIHHSISWLISVLLGGVYCPYLSASQLLDACSATTFWLWWVMLLWTLLYICFRGNMFVFFWVYSYQNYWVIMITVPIFNHVNWEKARLLHLQSQSSLIENNNDFFVFN